MDVINVILLWKVDNDIQSTDEVSIYTGYAQQKRKKKQHHSRKKG